MEAFAVVDPELLVAVNVYVVFAAGETLRVPDAATVPMPWSMLTVVALAVDQVNVDAAPIVIDVGDAESVAVGIGGGWLGSVSMTSCLISFIFCTPSQPLRPYPSNVSAWPVVCVAGSPPLA